MNCQACGANTSQIISDSGFLICDRCKKPDRYFSSPKSSELSVSTSYPPQNQKNSLPSSRIVPALKKQKSLALRFMIFVAWSVVGIFVIRFIVNEWAISQGAPRYGTLTNAFASFLLSIIVFPLLAYTVGMLFTAATRKSELAPNNAKKSFEFSEPSERSKARSVEERLNELKRLHDSGLIDASDYSLKKQNILSDL
jgi:hypothetical protein